MIRSSSSPTVRRLVSATVAAVFVLAAPLPALAVLPGAPPAAAGPGWAAPHGSDTDALWKKGEKKKEEEKGGEKDKDKKPEEKKEKPFEEAVKDTKEVKGLFTFYVKEDEGKVLVELLPDQLDKTFLFNATLDSGTGEGFLLAAAMAGEFPIQFHKVGKNIQLIQKNVAFRADEKKPISRAVEKGFSDSILGQAKIESAPHPERKSVLVDLGTYVMNDFLGIGQALKFVYQTGYSFDKETSSFGQIGSFPENSEIEVLSVFKTGDPKGSMTLPDPRSLQVSLRYSVSALKDTGYRPRLADDRVGHFLTIFQDYSSDKPDVADVRYVNRWHLEKKDPLSTVSEVKEPIVFWIEKTVPEEYREAVRDGVLEWNKAFEKIGLKNAIEAKIQPDDADWDPADSRYSTIRWIVAPGAGFAQGPSRANPFTGQIYDADIRFASDMMRFTLREYAEEIKPVQYAPDPSLLSKLPRGLGRFDPARLCNFAEGASLQAGFGWDLLAARGVLDKDSPEAKKYLRDFIVHVTAHEVGHTLGLRHNFKASVIHKVPDLQNPSITEPLGVTGSVMDYTPVNLAPQGHKQGQYWQTTLGTYDYWAIEYAYKPIDAERPEDELPELKKIASRAADPQLAYGTDEDTWGFSTTSVDPRSNLWDLGEDPIVFYRGRLGNARELWARLAPTFEQPGMQYQKMRQVFGRAVIEHTLAGLNVSKIIGGIYHNRDHVGDPDGRLPFVPVSAARQREALEFLKEHIFGPKALQFSPDLLDKLAPERLPDLFGSSYFITRLDYPIHAVVLSMQGAPLSRLYDTITLQRLNDLEARESSRADRFTMADVFGGLREAIWAELKGGQNVNSFRRNLQRRHLDHVVALVVQPQGGLPEDARSLARADLKQIRTGIDSAMKSPGMDAMTRAHLDETRDRIDAVLAAQIERALFPRIRIGG